MTHTKGPWRVTQDSGEIGTADGKIWVARAINATTTEGRSNAHLIAAAPELLEALRETRRLVSEGLKSGFCHDGDDTWAENLFDNQAAITAAIAKAEGRT